MKSWQIGWLAAKRNWRRSGLAVAALALATLALLLGSTAIPISTPIDDAGISTLFGGNVLVLPYQIPVRGVPGEQRDKAVALPVAPDALPLYVDFHPEASAGGILTINTQMTDLAAWQSKLQAISGLSNLHPLHVLPAYLRLGERSVPVWIEGRAPSDPSLKPYVVAGTAWSGPADDGALLNAAGELADEGVLTSYWAGNPTVLAGTWPKPGETVQLQVPTWQGTAQGGHFDYTQLQPVSLAVRGLYKLPMAHVDWRLEQLTAQGFTNGGGFGLLPHQETMWVGAQTVMVTWQTWQALANRVFPAGIERPSEWVGTAPSSFLLGRAVNRINGLNAPLSAWSVHDVVASADWHSGILTYVPRLQAKDAATLDFRSVNPIATPANHALPDSLRFVVLAAFYLMAGLLLFSHIRLLLLVRMEEMAALRALGYSRSSVTASLLTELMGMSLLGTLIGYALSSPYLIAKWGPERLGFTGSVQTLAEVLGMAVGLGFLLTLVLALPAALAVLRLPVREVFRRA